MPLVGCRHRAQQAQQSPCCKCRLLCRCPAPEPLPRSPLQSLTADLFPAARRGRAFGCLYLTAALGGMLGALYATNLGGWMGW